MSNTKKLANGRTRCKYCKKSIAKTKANHMMPYKKGYAHYACIANNLSF